MTVGYGAASHPSVIVGLDPTISYRCSCQARAWRWGMARPHTPRHRGALFFRHRGAL